MAREITRFKTRSFSRHSNPYDRAKYTFFYIQNTEFAEVTGPGSVDSRFSPVVASRYSVFRFKIPTISRRYGKSVTVNVDNKVVGRWSRVRICSLKKRLEARVLDRIAIDSVEIVFSMEVHAAFTTSPIPRRLEFLWKEGYVKRIYADRMRILENRARYIWRCTR